MDVTLPNGKVIKGIPDGTPKEAIMQKAIASGLATERDFNITPKEVAPPQEDKNLVDNAIGVAGTVAGGLEGALALGSGLVADAAGGLAGIGAAINPFNEEGAGAERAKYVQELLTYQPKTEEGQALMQRISTILSPVAEKIQGFEKNLGDYTMEKTGSPLAASVATALPTLAGELIGAGAGSRMARSAAQEATVAQAKNAAIKAIDAKEASTGVKQLTTDALPPDTRAGKFMQQQGEVVAGGERAGQQSQRIKAVENLLGEYSIDDLARYESKIVDGIKEAVGNKKAVFASQYQDLTNNLNNFGALDIPSTRDFAAKVIAKEEKKGALADKTALSQMQDFIDAPESMDFETVKSVRSAVGRDLEAAKKGSPLQGSSDVGMLSQLYKQLTNDMRSFADTVDPELAAKWKKADNEFSQFALGNDKSGARALVKKGDATPEIIDQLLFSKKTSDIDFIKKNITKEGLAAAKQRVLQMALNKSSYDGIEMNPNKFQTQIDKLKPQINIIFDAQEKAAINNLNQVLKDTRRAQDAAVATATGQSLVPFMLFTNPAALSLGVVQAIVEKPMLRNILVKRKAAKTAKERALFDAELEKELVKMGLIGGAAGGSLTATNKEKK